MRQLDGRTVDRPMPVAVTAGDDDAVGSAVVGDRAVGSGQHRIQRLLQPQQPVPVPVDAADDVGRQRPAGVLAQILSFRTDLGVLVGDRAGDGGVDGARQIDEIVVALQLLQHGRGVRLVAQPGGDLRGDVAQPLLGIGGRRVLVLGLLQLLANPLGLERQRARLGGERQLILVAVDDAAAHRLFDVGDLELAGGLGAQRRRVGHLQDEQLDRRHHDQHPGSPRCRPDAGRRTTRRGCPPARSAGCAAPAPSARSPPRPTGRPDGLSWRPWLPWLSGTFSVPGRPGLAVA